MSSIKIGTSVKVQVHFFHFQYKMFCILDQVCANTFLLTVSLVLFTVGTLQVYPLNAPTPSFLDSQSSSGFLSLRRPPDFPAPASRSCSFLITCYNKPMQSLLDLENVLNRYHLGWQQVNPAEYTVANSHTDTLNPFAVDRRAQAK